MDLREVYTAGSGVCHQDGFTAGKGWPELFQIAANSGLGHGVSDYRHGDCSSGVRITLATGTRLLRNGRCLREAMVSRQLKAFHVRCKRYMRVRVDRSVRSWIIKSVHIGT